MLGLGSIDKGQQSNLDIYVFYLLRPREEQYIPISLFELGENLLHFLLIYVMAFIYFVSVLFVEHDCEKSRGFKLEIKQRGIGTAKKFFIGVIEIPLLTCLPRTVNFPLSLSASIERWTIVDIHTASLLTLAIK